MFDDVIAMLPGSRVILPISGEPQIALATGKCVSAAVCCTMASLIARKHTVNQLGDGAVYVTPPCHPDVQFVVQASWHDTGDILEAIGQ